LKIGFQESDITEMRQSFFPIRKADCKDHYNDPIIELLECYNHTLDNIVYFEFVEQMTIIKDKYWLFGYYDDNPLVIDKSTNEILNLNAHHGQKILYRCAENSFKFLEAALESIHTEPIINKFKSKKEERLFWAEVATKCIDKAGGRSYKEFYEMVCDISINI
jgi:hypothetical protein